MPNELGEQSVVIPQEDAELYERLVREVRDYAIFMLNPDGTIRTWNTGAERLKGYKPAEIIGRHFSQFYPPEDIQAQKPQRELVTALAEGRFEDEGWRIRSDGSRFWANVIITAIYDDHGGHVGFAKVTRDLTERRAAEEALRAELIERRSTETELRKIRSDLERRVEERTAALKDINIQLRQANIELEKAGRMKDQFLAILSHELRTPLTAIYGWLSILQTGRVAESGKMKALAVIERSVKAQSQLIEDLLNVSRIITGNLKIAPLWMEPMTIIHNAVDSIRPAANAKEINIVIEATDAGPIFADPDRLQQMIWNLLTNSVKFTGKGGEVRIEVGRIASTIQITVSDTGEGISPEFLPHVFDRFSQADASLTRKFGGLGLGLNIVRHLAELHGGSVIAHSEGIGRGTTFIIRMPIPAIRIDKIPNSDERRFCSLDGVKVMVVEDEADTREMLRVALEGYGASVVVAASAADALEQIVHDKPELLLSDIGLPNVDGYQLLSTIRSDLPEEVRDIPAVALTAFAGGDHPDKAKRVGYQAHITKPVAIPDLISILAKVIKDR